MAKRNTGETEKENFLVLIRETMLDVLSERTRNESVVLRDSSGAGVELHSSQESVNDLLIKAHESFNNLKSSNSKHNPPYT